MKSPRRSRCRNGAEFRARRIGAGLTQLDLANLFEVTTVTLSRWENNHGAIPAMAWLALEQVVGNS
jgi:transcriptional regulator with XRE-family HTH domain